MVAKKFSHRLIPFFLLTSIVFAVLVLCSLTLPTAWADHYTPSDEPDSNMPSTAHVYFPPGLDMASVFDIARGDDGITYVGGMFDYIGPFTGPAVPLSLTTGKPAGDFPIVDGYVLAIAPDNAGGWYLGGDFTQVDGEPRTRLAHILPDGSLDATWTPAANALVEALSVHGDILYVGGNFTTVGGLARERLAAIDSAGAATNWNPGTSSTVRAIVATTESVYIGGNFQSIAGQPRAYLAAIDPTGNLTSWNPGSSGYISALAVTSDTVYAGGFDLLAIDSSGALVPPPFWRENWEWYAPITALAADGDRLYYMAQNEIGALTPSGETVWSVNMFQIHSIPEGALAVSDGVLYAGGDFWIVDNTEQFNLAAIDSAGNLIPTFPGASGPVLALAAQGDTIYAGGAFEIVGGEMRGGLAAFDEDGIITDWGANTYADPAWHLAVAKNRILVSGEFWKLDGQDYSGGPVMFDTSGSVIATLDRSLSDQALATDGNTFFIGGMAAVDTFGTLTGWNPGLAMGWRGKAMTWANGTVYMGGDISSGARLAAVSDQPPGALLPWSPSVNGYPQALTFSDDVIYTGGEFTSVNGLGRNYLAAITTAGEVVDWNPSANGTVRALAVREKLVYAAGDFSQIAGQPRSKLAAVDQAGQALQWAPKIEGDYVHDLYADQSGVYVGGDFQTERGRDFARFSIEGEPPLNPALSSESPALVDWSADPTVSVTLSGATDTVSGVEGYSIVWTKESTGSAPKMVIATAGSGTDDHIESPVLDTGRWFANLRTKDHAGNWASTVHLGPFMIDTTPPDDPTLSSPSHDVENWSSDPAINLAIHPDATDTASGVVGYAISWSKNGTETPPQVMNLADSGSTTTTTETVLSDGTWYANVSTKDNAGNWTSTAHLGPFKIDTNAPIDPTLSSPSHAPGAWSNNNIVDLNIHPDATDSGSDVAGYSVSFSLGATETPPVINVTDTASATDTYTSSVLGDGFWYINLRTADNAGNWTTTVNIGPFKIDTGLPSDPTLSSPSHALDSWSSDVTVTIELSDATDTASSIAGYAVSWNQNSTETPPQVMNLADSGSTTTTTGTVLGDGIWYANVSTKDNAGNWTSTAHKGPFKIDASAPIDPTLSSPSHAPGTWSNDRTVDLTIHTDATDAGSGVSGYSVSWTEASPGTADQVVDIVSSGDTTEATTSLPLADGLWYANVSTVDSARNWTATVHKGPFKIDAIKPTASIKINNGDTFTNSKNVTLNISADDTGGAGLWLMRTRNKGGAWSSWVNYATTLAWTLSNGDGTKEVELEVKDRAYNHSNMVSDTINLDTTKPTASIEINGGADYTTDYIVTLNLSASDGAGSGPHMMRFSTEALMIDSLSSKYFLEEASSERVRISNQLGYGAWSSWEPYATTKNWTLLGADTDIIKFQVKDKAGNISDVAEDWISLDRTPPEPTLETPFVSTRISKTTTFKVRWGAYVERLGYVYPDTIDSYTVRYRPSTSSTWRTWKSNTKSTYGYFTGKAGVTYSFRIKAVDKAGNIGWSKASKTIVPFNEGIYYSKTGFYGYKKNSNSQNYLSSVRYSYVRGHSLRYKLYNNNGIGLVVTKGPNMGRAKIYVDGKYVTTVNAYKSSKRARQLIFYKGFAKKDTHWLKVVNLGTPGRAKFEVDGVVVKR